MTRYSLLGCLLAASLMAAQAGVAMAQDAAEETYGKTRSPDVDLSLPSEEAGTEDPQAASPESEPVAAPPDTGQDSFGAWYNQDPSGEAGLDDTALGSDRPMGASYYLRVFAVLCFVIAFIIIVGYIARRVGRRTAFLPITGLGEVIGRVYLARGATLHYVRTGGRILVVGVANANVSLVAEFDAAAFNLPTATAEPGAAPANPVKPAGDFLTHLQASSRQIKGPLEHENDEDEIASLRGDVQRLQRHLQEGPRGQHE